MKQPTLLELNPKRELLEDFPSSPGTGYRLWELKNAAIAHGLLSYTVTMRTNPKQELKEQILKGRPIICAINFPRGFYFAYDLPMVGQVYRSLAWAVGERENHYVVAFGITDEQVLLMDPAFGFVAYNWKRFETCWSKLNFAALICARKAEENERGYSKKLEKGK